MVDAQVDIISGLIALSRVSAGIIYHHTLQLDLSLSSRQLISLHNFISQPGPVDACVTLTRDVEIIFLKVGKFVEESDQSFVVVLGRGSIIACQAASLRHTEPYTRG